MQKRKKTMKLYTRLNSNRYKSRIFVTFTSSCLCWGSSIFMPHVQLVGGQVPFQGGASIHRFQIHHSGKSTVHDHPQVSIAESQNPHVGGEDHLPHEHLELFDSPTLLFFLQQNAYIYFCITNDPSFVFWVLCQTQTFPKESLPPHRVNRKLLVLLSTSPAFLKSVKILRSSSENLNTQKQLEVSFSLLLL